MVCDIGPVERHRAPSNWKFIIFRMDLICDLKN